MSSVLIIRNGEVYAVEGQKIKAGEDCPYIEGRICGTESCCNCRYNKIVTKEGFGDKPFNPTRGSVCIYEGEHNAQVR